MSVKLAVWLSLAILFAVFAVNQHSIIVGLMAASTFYLCLVQVHLARKKEQREIESLNL